MKILSRERSDYLSNTDVWMIESTNVGDRFRICVSGPEQLPADGQRVGAIYATDGDLSIGAVTSMARALALAAEYPPAYTVGICYPLDHSVPHIAQRNRDLTPAPDALLEQMTAARLGMASTVQTGGANAFLAFINGELRPLLESEYPIEPSQGLLTGGSLGGLFALHALLTEPAAFRHYLAISPAAWVADRELFGRVRSAAPFADGLEGGVFICVGGLETNQNLRTNLAKMPEEVQSAYPETLKRIDMVADMHAMTEAIATLSPPGFPVIGKEMPLETHCSVLGVALGQGLRVLNQTLPALT